VEKPVESVHNFPHILKIPSYGNDLHIPYSEKIKLFDVKREVIGKMQEFFRISGI